MYRIVRKRVLNSQVRLYEAEAPRVAKKAQPGQFVIIRIGEGGERVPFTISEADAGRGTVTFIVQEVGKTTKLLSSLEEGDYLQNLTGPLGRPTHFSGNVKRAVVIGGGLGSAIAYPQAKNLLSRGAQVVSIVGFRTKDLVILEEEMKSASTRLIITTDDGSYGEKGFVTEALKKLLNETGVPDVCGGGAARADGGNPGAGCGGANFDAVVAIGPPVMMKAVCEMTKPFNIQTIVSLNPIMVDGTGMCGCCRVTVSGRTRFACVDGPDFDGHEVDFNELMRRNAMYREQEKTSLDTHVCRLLEEAADA